MPLTSLFSTKFQQPLLGGNYLEIYIIPSPDGGLTNGTKAEIRLQDRGLFEFASALDKTRERAIEARRNQGPEEGEGLRQFYLGFLYPCQWLTPMILIQRRTHLRPRPPH